MKKNMNELAKILFLGIAFFAITVSSVFATGSKDITERSIEKKR